jgi:hypothetical protein
MTADFTATCYISLDTFDVKLLSIYVDVCRWSLLNIYMP